MSSVFFKVKIPETNKNAYVIIDCDGGTTEVLGATFMNVVFMRVPKQVWSYPHTITEVFLHELVHVKQFHRGVFKWLKRRRSELCRIEDELEAYTDSLIDVKYGTYSHEVVRKLSEELTMYVGKFPEKYLNKKDYDKHVIRSFRHITKLCISERVLEIINEIKRFPRDFKHKVCRRHIENMNSNLIEFVKDQGIK